MSESKDLKSYTIPLKMRKESRWEDKHNPQLIVNTKYVPYAALRQQLWRCLLNQYDADDSGYLTRVELVTMLDSLGSTLSEKTIDGFFQRFRQSPLDQPELPEAEELTIDQAVICLEDQLLGQPKTTVAKEVSQLGSAAIQDTHEHDTSLLKPPDDSSQPSLPESESNGSHGLTDPDDKSGEHVIMITECPLCHQPRLNKRSEVDIVTHLATCASQDWRQMDHVVMGGFVTADQAHRKWYSKVYPPRSLLRSDHLKDHVRRISIGCKFCEYPCSGSADWTNSRRENERLCPVRDSTVIQRIQK